MLNRIRCTVTILLYLFLLNHNAYAENHEIAITVDDLPFVGSGTNTPGNLKRTQERFTRIMDALTQYQVPATGFVIAGSIGTGEWDLLESFKSRGFILGNHTYSHISLGQTSAEKYIENIAKADQKLTPLMSTPKYFRYPYLSEGQGAKKQQVHDYLAANGYVIAPVTIDSKDFRFNAQFLALNWRVRDQYLGRFKQNYLNYIWTQTERAEKRNPNKPQILLIHANLLNSHLLGDILKMYQDKGFHFISLESALTQYKHEPMIKTEPEKTASMSNASRFFTYPLE